MQILFKAPGFLALHPAGLVGLGGVGRKLTMATGPLTIAKVDRTLRVLIAWRRTLRRLGTRSVPATLLIVTGSP